LSRWGPLASAALVAACTDHGGLDARIDLTVPAEADAVPLARVLVVSTPLDVTARLTLADDLGSRSWDVAMDAGDHAVPVLGFHPGEHATLDVELLAGDGRAADASFDVRPADVPDPFPTIDVLALDPDRVEPGWTLFDALTPDGTGEYLVILDEGGRVVWWWEPGFSPGDARVGADGNLWLLGDGDAFEADFLGTIVRRWSTATRTDPGWVPTTAGALNHELFVTDDGFWSLHDGSTDVPDLPRDYDALDALRAATIDDPAVVELGFDGVTRHSWKLSERLQTSRIGYDSLRTLTTGFDWAHANGVVPDPSDGGVIVSVRHQDAIVKLDGDGELAWILGTPAGWSPELAAKVLTPVGEPFAWPYHAHAPELEDDGLLVMFDNQRWGSNPYEPEVEPPPSRVVGFRVDAVAHTVEQEFAFDATTTGPLRCEAIGDADVQPITGNVLADYGFVADENGVTNAENGWGRMSARLVEYAPDGDVVADWRVRSDVHAEAEGWKVYRAERIAPP
jgi:hypothetical protein